MRLSPLLLAIGLVVLPLSAEAAEETTPGVELEEESETAIATPTADSSTVALTEEQPRTPEDIKSAVMNSRKEGLEALQLGAAEKAYGHFVTALEDCAALGEIDCPAKSRAVLFVDVGIALAMQEGKHGAAVQVFKRAIKLDRSVSIPSEFETPQSRRAFVEAKGGRFVAPSAESNSQETTPKVAERGNLLVLAGVSFGIVMLPGTSSSTGFSGNGAATFAFSPTDSNFVIGGRVKGGLFAASGKLGYFQPGFDIGFASQPTNGNFVYLLTSPGFVIGDFQPTFAQDTRFGFSLSGFDLGLGVNLIVDKLVVAALEARLGYAAFN